MTHRVMPDIPKSARNTIHGTIKVTVHVDVSPAGKVVAAKFKTTGSSQYFAQEGDEGGRAVAVCSAGRQRGMAGEFLFPSKRRGCLFPARQPLAFFDCRSFQRICRSIPRKSFAS